MIANNPSIIVKNIKLFTPVCSMFVSTKYKYLNPLSNCIGSGFIESFDIFLFFRNIGPVCQRLRLNDLLKN